MVEHTPVIAGVCATDPFRSMPSFLKQLKEIGFAGVQNFPTVCLPLILSHYTGAGVPPGTIGERAHDAYNRLVLWTGNSDRTLRRRA